MCFLSFKENGPLEQGGKSRGPGLSILEVDKGFQPTEDHHGSADGDEQEQKRLSNDSVQNDFE
jgi:hypothetical protein